MTFDLPPLIFTLCFLTRHDDVLMLHRSKPPNRGLWNGVGGHIEPGEGPLESVLREVTEETGYVVPAARFCGLLTWEGYEIPAAGLYIFAAPAPDGELPGSNGSGEYHTREGTLAWKPRHWIFTSDEVPSNIHYFGPLALGGAEPMVYHFVYRAGLIQRHEVRPLPEGFRLSSL